MANYKSIKEFYETFKFELSNEDFAFEEEEDENANAIDNDEIIFENPKPIGLVQHVELVNEIEFVEVKFMPPNSPKNFSYYDTQSQVTSENTSTNQNEKWKTSQKSYQVKQRKQILVQRYPKRRQRGRKHKIIEFE